MTEKRNALQILIVDDEEAFRASASKVLSRRNFIVSEAANGLAALEMIRSADIDVVLLDLKMPGMDGITALQKIREIKPELPVIILTGHGDFNNAVAGIKLGVVDFVNKPVEMDALAGKIIEIGSRRSGGALREKMIPELMSSIDKYQKVYVDQSVEDAIKALWKTYFQKCDTGIPQRSILIFDRRENFVGIIRFHDLMRLVIPEFLDSLPSPSYFTGMFLAQCKLIGKQTVEDLIEDKSFIGEEAPLIKAVHMMVSRHLVNLPVLAKDGRLAGILRESDVIQEIMHFVI
jgi:CheY-like chemotaxis protein